MAEYRLLAVRNPSFTKEGEMKANKVTGTTYYLPEWGCVADYEDLVLLPNKAYSEIFGKKRSEDALHRKRLAIVRIRYNGVSIYRAYRGMNVGSKNIGLTMSSIRYFGTDNDRVLGQSLLVNKGWWFPYYWSHPFHATRISCRLGVISLGLGILSLLLGFLSLC